jgi:uncharacterized protein
MASSSDYYVYVYIDPRNFEEFYYGKGRGSRKDAHLSATCESDKSRRIAEIRRAGLHPIVRVIARNLSTHDALLVEKTLLWKLGKNLTNIATGSYSDNFRPHDTMHSKIAGFDYRRGIYYYNVGEGPNRNWDDYLKFGFISAGGGVRWRDAILGFEEGDVVVAYLKNHGFVGVAQITVPARRIREVKINGRPLLNCALNCKGMDRGVDSPLESEYVALVRWLATAKRSKAKWQRSAGLYTTTHVRASLDGQPKTIAFIEAGFGVDLRALVT